MICTDCGQSCSPVLIDLGIGPYEFWGERGVHHEYHDLSPCCHADVVAGGEKVVRKTTHTARKQHNNIMPGDRYELTVIRHHRKGGPSWITTQKRKI